MSYSRGTYSSPKLVASKERGQVSDRVTVKVAKYTVQENFKEATRSTDNAKFSKIVTINRNRALGHGSTF